MRTNARTHAQKNARTHASTPPSNLRHLVFFLCFADERKLFDLARRKGFVEIEGSGWRRQRSDAPLVNTYRNWCDAKGEPAIYVHKARDGMDDVVVDLSPLRTPGTFKAAARYCLRVAAASGANTGDGDGDSVAGSGQGQIEGLEQFLTPE
eukprot:3971983-Pleurochrysis_carterae.AAC.1